MKQQLKKQLVYKDIERRGRKRGRPSSKNREQDLELEDLKFLPFEEIEKKIFQKAGKIPVLPRDLTQGDWTEQGLKVLEERYLAKDNQGTIVETPDQMCWRVAWEAASAEALYGKSKIQISKLAKDFYHLLIKRKFLPNSPTLMNAGTGGGLQYSGCFVLPVGDSMEEIFDALKAQALVHKSGGGTGFSFSRLRPRGSMVKSSGGVASGPVSFMRIFDATTNEVKQGGRRRGANMGILRADHPDIQEFIHCKESGGITNFNISVALTDEFMEAYRKDEEYSLVDPKTKKKIRFLKARELFDEIAEAAWKTGDPGLVFIDEMNRGNSNPVPSLGPVEATNPCITGETLISTAGGLKPIQDLYQEQKVTELLVDKRLADQKFSRTQRIIRTGIKRVYRLRTKEGYEIRLTKDHQLMTSKGWVKAENLIEGDDLFISSRKGGFGQEGSLEEGRILGWLVGDGTMKASTAILSFFGSEKQELSPQFATMVENLVDGTQILNRRYPISPAIIDGRDEARVGSTRLWRYAIENEIRPGDKLKVPPRVLSGTEEMQRGFLQALFTADGHVSGTLEKGISGRLTSISKNLLLDVQRLLLNFGIASKIYFERRQEQYRLLADGKGGTRKYWCKTYHDLVISKRNLYRFAEEIGFLSEHKNLKLLDWFKNRKRGPYRETFLVKFESLEPDGEDWVYDLTEPLTSSFIANGLVVHNCGEQILYPFDACNLGSIFLNHLINKKNGQADLDWDGLKETVRSAVRFLDNIIDVNPFPLKEIRQTVLAIRRIGLGVGGWADALIELGISYASQEALDLAEKVMRVIQREATLTTQELAEEKGPFPLWPVSIYRDQKPRRNSTLTTIAPTGSISIIAGASSGIEPLFAIAFQHIVKDQNLDRTLTFINPKLEEVSKKRGFWTEEIKEKVISNGVLHGVTEIPEDIKQLFATAHEIDFSWHVRTQAAFQKYTDNAVSKTINLDNEATVDQVKQAYLLAWEEGCQGITVFRDGCKDAQVINIGLIKEGKEEKEKMVVEPTMTRPFKVIGATYKLNTPVGTAFVTINEDLQGEPLEIFINVGKAGSDITAIAEALGRTISTSLRFRGHLSPRARAEEIARQLAGIGGRRSVGFGPNKVRSLPDAVATALGSHFGFHLNGNGHKPINGEEKVKSQTEPSVLESEPLGDICPACGASTFVYQEGCSKCYACAYSEC